MEAKVMIKTTTEILIKKLKAGEKVTCPKCKEGDVIYKHPEGHKYPDIYCNNPDCDAKIMFD